MSLLGRVEFSTVRCAACDKVFLLLFVHKKKTSSGNNRWRLSPPLHRNFDAAIRGKGDHRHYGEREEAYEFKNIDTLIADFMADVPPGERRERVSKVQIHVGETMEDVGARAIDAWHRMEKGEAAREKHVSFERVGRRWCACCRRNDWYDGLDVRLLVAL